MAETVETGAQPTGRDGALPLPELETDSVALDFVNTVEWRGRAGAERGDYLVSYDALLRWAEHAGALGPAEVQALAQVAAARPDAARAALDAAVELREALHVLLPTERDAEAGGAELAVLNAVVADALSAPRLVRSGGGLTLAWPTPATRLDAPTWPVARAAVELLTARSPRWVRACANAECGWLFFDESRGHRRRWCSMASCGNRAKARRHYARTRARRAAGD